MKKNEYSYAMVVESAENFETRASPISAWLQLANFGTLAVASLLAFKVYLALQRLYKWITMPSPSFDDVRVILVLGPKTELNNAILRRISEKFQVPITLLNENETKSAPTSSTSRHLIYGGSWAPENQEDVIRLSSFIKSQYGYVDVLLVSEASQVPSSPPSNFLSQLNQQLLAQFWIAMAFLPGMLERNRGAILSVAMGRKSALANAGVMRTIFEDILQKDTKVTLTLVEKNTFLSRFLPTLPTDFLAGLIVEGLGHHRVLFLPSVTHYLFHLPKAFAQMYLKPLLDHFHKPHSISSRKNNLNSSNRAS